MPELQSIFYSIEVNPKNYAIALRNLLQNKLFPYVRVLNGLSLPRDMLLTKEQIQKDFVDSCPDVDIFTDHEEWERSDNYYLETNHIDVPDNLLGLCLKQFDFCPELLVLDSAGHLGFIEFNYIISQLNSPCYLALDDIYHIKHHKSFTIMKNDARFKIIKSSKEKFGFCIAKFNPNTPSIKTSNEKQISNSNTTLNHPIAKEMAYSELDFNAIERILYIRLDGIGDAILANALLDNLPEVFPSAQITVACDQACTPIYESSPVVASVLSINKHATSDEDYLKKCVKLLKSSKPDLIIQTTNSLPPDISALTLSLDTPVLGVKSDTINQTQQYADVYNNSLSYPLTITNDMQSELMKYDEIAKQLGCTKYTPKAKIWLSEKSIEQAKLQWADLNFDHKKTIAIFSGGSIPKRNCTIIGKALVEICTQHDLSVVALGAEAEYGINEENIQHLRSQGIRTRNLSGMLDILTTAAFLSKCRLAVGVDTSLAHIAAALDVPHVIVLNGSQVGRFLPCHPTTTAVCLPLECFGCAWRCLYPEPYCLSGIKPEFISAVVEKAISSPTPKSGAGRIFLQPPMTWKRKADRPRWRSPQAIITAQSQLPEDQRITFF